MRELIGAIAALVAGWIRRRRPTSGASNGPAESKKRVRVVANGLAVMLALADAALAAPSRPTLRADSGAVSATARSLKVGAGLRIEGLPVEIGSPDAALELNRVDVFTADAEIVLYGEQGEARLAAPKDIYLRGFVDSDLSSTAVLSVSPSGRVRGIIRNAKGVWAVGTKRDRLVTRKTNLRNQHSDRKFECGTEDPSEDEMIRVEAEIAGEMVARAAALPVAYTARVAVDTDYEFLWLPAFRGSTTAATRYVGDLFAYLSAIYEAEVGTSLKVSSLYLRTTMSDPWTATSTATALGELRDYWNANYSNVSRSTAHFLSGKPLQGGRANINALCMKDAAYGVSGSLGGDYSPRNPDVVWDSYVVAHELGHNFGSPHTHCYVGIGGNAAPVDKCYGLQAGGTGSACYSGDASLPCSASGAGCGTIMSYCHLLNGGMSNISMTFGLNHPFGAVPDRVPTRMAGFIASRAASFPGCLTLLPSTPSGVTATDGTYTDKVRLAWTQTTGASSYRILRNLANSVAGAAAVGTSTALTYDDTSATPGTTYWYWIVALNGSAESSVSSGDSGYRRLVSPPSALTGSASGVGMSSATLQAQVNPNGLATTVYFQWGTTTSYANTTPSQVLGTGTTSLPATATLAGLTPGLTYNYRVVATNSAGKTLGANMTWTASTSECVVGTISSDTTITDSLSASGCRAASRGSSYYADRFQFDGLAGQHIMLRMSSTAFDTYMYLSSRGTLIAADDNGGGGTNSRIPMGTASFVLPWTGSYTIEVTSLAKNVAGKYSLAFVKWATTPAPTATTGGATGISPTKATLEGSVTPKGLTTSVSIEWGTTIAYGNVMPLGVSGGLGDIPVKVALSGLTPNTKYHFRVGAGSSAGFAYGADVAWQTPAAP